jgi:hypothetical protein
MRRSLAIVFVSLLLSAPAAVAAVDCARIPAGTNEGAIQSCLDRGGTVALMGGTYSISTGLRIKVAGTILRPVDTFSVATLVRAVNTTNPGPLLTATNLSGFTIERIYFDGNRTAFTEAQRTDLCVTRAKTMRHNVYNVRLLAVSNFEWRDSQSRHAVCGTGAEIDAANFLISQTGFRSNGTNVDARDTKQLWADGLTLLRCENGRILNNWFEDNTDLDLVIGGGKNCQVSGNRITHTAQYGFGGLSVSWFPPGAGQHQGSVITNNTVVGNGRLMFGIILGDDPWRPFCIDGVCETCPNNICPVRAFNATVTNNSARGAMVNLAIDGVRGFKVSGNVLSSPAGTNAADALLPGCPQGLPWRGFYTQNYTAAHVESSCIQPGFNEWRYDGHGCTKVTGTVQQVCP